MKEYQVIKVWSCSKKEESLVIGFVRAFLAECSDGIWLVVTPETHWGKSEIMILETRLIAMKRLREQGFFTRVNKIYSTN